MKGRILCCLCSFLLLLTGKAGAQVQSSCATQQDFLDAYDWDIKLMAVEDMYARHTPDTALIEIPLSARTPIMEDMSAVFNLGKIYDADSIFSIYCLHSDSSYYKDQLIYVTLYIDTTVSWTHAWLSGQTVTGNNGIDQLLAHYGFHVIHTQIYPGGPVSVELRTDTHPVNCRALADSLKSFAGIVGGYAGGVGGIGSFYSHIQRFSMTYPELDFTVGLGGWGTGGIRRKYRVFLNCNVSLIGVEYFWSYYPMPISNCGLHPNITLSAAAPRSRELNIFPNPATEVLQYTGLSGGESYSICNMQGSVLLRGMTVPGSGRIDVRELPPAAYMLRITDRSGQTAFRAFSRL